MKARFESSFARDLRGIKDQKLKKRITEAIQRFESVDHLFEIDGVKKLRGTHAAYRLRIGEYRLGFLLRENSVILVRFLNRKEIYRYFP